MRSIYEHELEDYDLYDNAKINIEVYISKHTTKSEHVTLYIIYTGTWLLKMDHYVLYS